MAEPEHGCGDEDSGAVIGGSLGVARGEIAELFEPVEAALDAGGPVGRWSRR
jgi:hypothetical protein